MIRTRFDPLEQHAALCVLDYVSNLFMVAERDTFRKEDVPVVLSLVKNDKDIFDPECVAAFDQQ